VPEWPADITPRLKGTKRSGSPLASATIVALALQASGYPRAEIRDSGGRSMPLTSYSETVTRLFDAVLDERLAPDALKAVANYVGASGAGYLLVSKLTGQVSTITWWGSFTGSRADYLAHYSRIDPFRAIQEEAACGALSQLLECLSAQFLSRDEWYNDFVLKGGVRDVLGTKLHENRSHFVIVGLHRAIGDTRPIPEDAEALRMLMAPLRNAARLHLGLISIGFRSAIARGRLDHLHASVIFTDSSGRIIETNRLGEAILRTGDGLTMRSGQICARRSFETVKLARLIAKATAEEGSRPSAGCMLIARDNGRPSYVVRVVPAAIGGLTGDDMPMAMLMISTPEERRASGGELAELYGLSPAESRIAIALTQGKRLTALAAELGLQITTLRSQMSSTLRKCGVERQSDLVHLISTIPPFTAPHPKPHPE
jgi:DNA-binding CsgD family transcriptional regulator